MGLVDFMQQLQEQDSSIIFSEEPEQSIKIIPPEKETRGIKIIPPTIKNEDVVLEQPKKVRIKLNKATKSTVSREVKSEETQVVTNQIVTNQVEQKQVVPQTVVQPQTQTVQTQPTQPPPIASRQETEEEVMERLFIKSGTEISKKPIWVEYYQKALVSRKQNIAVDRMKEGKFLITQDNQVLLLPDYEGKSDPDDILKDHWF